MQDDKNILAHQLTNIQSTLGFKPGEVQFKSPGITVLISLADKSIVYNDEKFHERLGYTPSALEQKDFTFLSLIDNAQYERFNMQVAYTLAGKTSNIYNAYHLHDSHGKRRVYYLYLYPVDAHPGLLQLYMLPEYSEHGVPFISFDTRELFLEQFGSFDFGTFEWIIESNKVYWSDSIYDIYDIDLSEREFDYDSVRKYTHPDDRERVAAHMSEAMKTGQGYDIELRIITRKDKLKVIKATTRIIKGTDGQPAKLVGSIRDITAQRATEQDLKKNVAELHKSNSELEEFAYVASHDLQEPLRKISTFCDRLSDKYSDLLAGEGLMYMERIMASAENMRVLIHNLLEFSRVSKAKEPAMPVSLPFIFHQVKQELELLIEETGAIIEIQAPSTVYASVVQMKQLFTNLLNNAIKFRKDDVAPIIKISSTPITQQEKEKYFITYPVPYEEIIVEDNGIGFDNEYAERIFQIFQRLHGKSEYPGSGIGLAICRKIVEKYKGVIFAEGMPGVGTRFHILLPTTDPTV